MKEKSQRYLTLKHHPGIRKDTTSNSYVVTKSFKGKRYYESFDGLRDAAEWKNSFNPNVPAFKLTHGLNTRVIELNGRDRGMNFEKAWLLYLQIKVATLEQSTIDFIKKYTEFFFTLGPMNMAHIFPEIIDEVVNSKKQKAILTNSRRMNFDHPLTQLRAFFNWYQENYDFSFRNPVLKRHFSMGMIKKPVERNKKMMPDEVNLFFSALPDFYRDFAIVQFYLASRVSEVAGLQFSSIDFKNSSILVMHVVVWDHCKRFMQLRPYTKNKAVRYCHMNETLETILRRRLTAKASGSDYVFHDDGGALSYRSIQHAYNRALKKCGLSDKYSSTHIMRHTMATITRLVTGSLDATQAVTGHKDSKLVQHYASVPEGAQKNAVIQVEAYMKKSQACEQLRANQNFQEGNFVVSGR
ncbi:MAG: tyrosine-type recombinase/integrase [Bdellovibrio sp.]|nr:tyrosine-type recombinase/integrase [Bdellovibrio sp.]